MAEPLLRALARMRGLLLDDQVLVRAVASGRQKGRSPAVAAGRAAVRRPQGRPPAAGDGVRRHPGAHLQPRARRRGPRGGRRRCSTEPFGNWHVETTTETHQLRVTKKREAMVHTTARGPTADPGPAGPAPRPTTGASRGCSPRTTRCCARSGSPTSRAGSSRAGRRSTARSRSSCASLGAGRRRRDRLPAGCARRPPSEPLRVVDLGCGNAYLTFAAHRYLTDVRGLPVHAGRGRREGAVPRAQHRRRRASSGIADEVTFVQGDIGSAELAERPDVVLALHACDTATDDALARAVTWEAPLVLAAPCCHHDVAAQLRRRADPGAVHPADPPRHPARAVRGHAHRRDAGGDAAAAWATASTSSSSSRASTRPRNTLLRAVRTGAGAAATARARSSTS